MSRTTIRQKLVQRLRHDFGLIVDPCDLESFRRNGYGMEITSWSTIKRRPSVESRLTMREVVEAPKLATTTDPIDKTIRVDLSLEINKCASTTPA